VRLIAKFFLVAWLIVALTWLPAAWAETPAPDADQSTRLTDYLHSHRLPLVGAQVLNSNAGPTVMLYGYTATDFGKSDAETKTRRYLKDSDVVINNHIRVRPELASMKSSAPSAPPSAGAAGEASPPEADAYSNYQQGGAEQQYTNQQAQQYLNQGNSGAGVASALIPLLGMGLAIGLGGGSGFGASGFGSPIPFGGSTTPYGGGYGSPYGGNPYGYPNGPSPYGPANPYP
jgi:hypothetical protein